MELWMFLMLLSAAAAAPAVTKDLTGKMLTFPEESKTAYVKVNVVHDNDFKAFTVCHRSFTDLTRDYSLFSLASPKSHNELLIFYYHNKKLISPHLHNAKVDFGDLDYDVNKWCSICTTWRSDTGLAQVWINGMPSIKKVAASIISGKPSVILGQEQDSYGKNFDRKQSFVGMLTDVHMWDHEISACDIQRYSEELSITPGNVINWAALDFKAFGKVYVEDKQVNCKSVCLQ